MTTAKTADRSTVQIRGETHRRIRRDADVHRLPLVEFIDAMSNGWNLLTDAQRVAAIQRPVKKTKTT